MANDNLYDAIHPRVRRHHRRTSRSRPMAETRDSTPAEQTQQTARANFHGVRYQVADVIRSIAFYTERFGFTLEHKQPPAFANVSLGPLQILLSGPGASGSRSM